MPKLGNSIEEDSYFQTRLHLASGLPASLAIDLAGDDNLDDDGLEHARELLGGPKAGDYGFGLGEVFEEFLSREPRKVPVKSLNALQQSLIKQGYMAPGTEVTGTWDQGYAAAFRRSEQAAANELRSGKSFVSASTETFFHYLGATVPSEVWKGVVGTAKGIVKQAPETAERLGALGGAVTGAGLGALVAGPVGAAVGGIGGGILGFAADFFGDDEDEEQQSALTKFWDALTPYQEYRGNPKAFFEDLGFMASAAALVTAGGAAARLTTAGVRQAAAGGFRTAITSVDSASRAGLVARGAAAATRPVSSNTAEWFLNASKYVRTNPVLGTIRGPYSMAAQAGLVGRLTGGLGSGSETSTIEGAIKETKPLGAGMRLPVHIPFFAPDGEVSDLIDLTASMVLYPEKLLNNPHNVGKAAKAINVATNRVNLDPYVEVARKAPDGSVRSAAEARLAALDMLGPTPAEQAAANTFYRFNFGLGQRASELVANQVGKLDDPFKAADLWSKAKGRLVRKVYREADEGISETAQGILSRSYEDPIRFTAFMKGIEGAGSELEKGKAFREASFMLQDASAAGILSKTRAPKFSDFDVAAARTNSKNMLAEAKTLEKAAEKQAGLSTAERIKNKERATQLRSDAEALKQRADKAAARRTKSTTKTTDKTPAIVPARKYDPLANDPGYLSRQDAERLADNYDKLADNVRAAWQVHVDKGPVTLAAQKTEDIYFASLREMDTFIGDLQFRGVLDAGPDVLASVRVPDPPGDVSTKLRKIAKLRGSDVEVPADMARKLDELGYKAVATGEDVLRLSDVPRVLETHGVSEYTIKEQFFAGLKSMGLGTRVDPDEGVAELRWAFTRSELHQVLQSEGIKLTGDSAAKKLSGTIKDGLLLKPGDAAKGPVVIKSDKTLPRLPRFDLRQLKRDEIHDALGLDMLVKEGEDSYALADKLYRAIHRGAAFGGEMNLAHPRQMLSSVANALGINGLPGVADFMRQSHLPGAKGTWSYLPEKLWNGTLAMRYALSPLFDASRYVEQTAMGKLKGQGAIPFMASPRRKIKGYGEFKHNPYGPRPVQGEEAWETAGKLYDEFIAGRRMMGAVDDLQRRFEAKGILGFSPKDWERAQTFFLYQQKAAGLGADISRWDPKELAALKDRVLTIGRYGSGRSPLEKTAHFVFFPISFQKKLYTSMVDYVASEPVRAMLIHQGVKRYEQLEEDGKLNEFLERWAPITKPLSQLNNLLYGASAGRFFLEGFGDEKPKAAQALQTITAALVPGGSHTPLHQAVASLFTPNVLDAEGVDKLLKSFDRVMPAFGDIFGEYGVVAGAKDQATALMSGGAPNWQFRNYVDGKVAAKAEYESMAKALGYASVDSFLRSEQGQAFAAQLDAKEAELGRQFPIGLDMASSFEVDTEKNRLALLDLAEKADRSEAEDAILDLMERRATATRFAPLLGISADEAIAMFTRGIREEALKHAGSVAFVNLWNRFLGDELGPITKTSTEAQTPVGTALSAS